MGFFDDWQKNRLMKKEQKKKKAKEAERARQQEIYEQDLEDAKAFMEEWDKKHADDRELRRMSAQSRKGIVTGKYLNNKKGYVTEHEVKMICGGLLVAVLSTAVGLITAATVYGKDVVKFTAQETELLNKKLSVKLGEVVEIENIEAFKGQNTNTLTITGKKITDDGKKDMRVVYTITDEQYEEIASGKSSYEKAKSETQITSSKTKKTKESLSNYYKAVVKAIDGAQTTYTVSSKFNAGQNL